MTNVAGSQYDITNNSNLSGAFAGAFGTDILPTDFTAVASSSTVGSFSGTVEVSLTLVPSNSSGVAVPGDTPVTHTFDPGLDIIDLNNSATDSSMSGIGVGSPIDVFAFADGSVFTVQLTSYTGPGAPGGSRYRSVTGTC